MVQLIIAILKRKFFKACSNPDSLKRKKKLQTKRRNNRTVIGQLVA